jgi:beta-mannosidase
MSRRRQELDGFRLVGTERGAAASADPVELAGPAGLAGPAALAGIPDEEWVAAVVPGGVHESLLAAGRIDDPYHDRNEPSVRWIEDRDWWYETTFDADPPGDGERLRLVCHGLDTVADLWLNGDRLGHHENMFRPAEFDLTDRVAPGRNVLVLRFSPPLAGLTPPPGVLDELGRLAAALGAPDEESGASDGGGLMSAALPLATLRRKATFSWGWDFGPRVPSIGIWRPIELVLTSGASIVEHQVRTDSVDVAGGRAELSIFVMAEMEPRGNADAVVEMVSPAGRTTTTTVPLSGPRSGSPHVDSPRVSGRRSVRIDGAEFWWTHDLGEPALYDVTVTLRVGGVVADVVRDRIGVRTIGLDRGADPEEGGRRFGFVLNGVPVFARGAAWLPADMMVGSVRAERHRELVRTARDGNLTMLRIWGGGVYEHDSFYAACDELGVLVWHDFMFACVDYPDGDPVLRREVELEAEYQVKRLRNRACLALWCGNNEVQLLHGFAYRGYAPDGGWGYDFFHRLLPDAVARYDGAVPYWPGSPYGESDTEGFMAVNGVLDGDRHAWEVWHGMDFGAGGGDFASVGEARHYRRYARDRGRFVSEFGIHAAPELSTLRAYLPADQLTVHSASFDHHNKDNPKDKHDAILEIVTGLPATVEEYVDHTMVSQAEGLKFGIEHYRRRQPHCGGALIWQYNDVWPGFSWSVVDYRGIPKAGWWYARRAFAPVLASFRYDGGALELWLTGGGRHPVPVDAEVTVGGLDGTVELAGAVAVTLAPGGSRPVWRAEPGSFEPAPDRVAWVSSPSGAFPANRLFFAEIKDIPFPPAGLETAFTGGGPGAGTLEITAGGYGYFVHVPSPAPGVRFSDNYFDLRAGDRATLTVTGLPAGLDPAELTARPWLGTAG